jgi:hypothetical protein
MTLAIARESAGKFRRIHGHANDGNGKRSPTYNSWRCMIARCEYDTHPYYARYGGRGIEVCRRWRYGDDSKTGFECFLEDMGPRPNRYYTLEREEGDGNYEKSNCLWACKRAQANNRCSNKLVKWKGKTMSLSAAVDSAGKRHNYPAIIARLGRGWTLQDAIQTPVAKSERPESKKRKGKRHD